MIKTYFTPESIQALFQIQGIRASSAEAFSTSKVLARLAPAVGDVAVREGTQPCPKTPASS